jgi:mannose-6-phosphate isomerase-like protein (cupin superfamily)
MERHIKAVEVVLPCPKLGDTLAFFTGQLGFRVDSIYPADCPTIAVVSGYGVCLHLEEGSETPPGILRVLCHNPAAIGNGASEIVAPNGTLIKLVEADPPIALPPQKQSFVVQKMQNGVGWTEGRAGMLYRDLIPDRQGGRFIASHIKYQEGGPVPDYVHFHKIRFQMIYCYKGWVRVGYEDQGKPLMVCAGDCLLQPPEIRHRVFESSPGLEVLEICCPAKHITIADHKLELPNSTIDKERDFGGQRFVHHQAVKASWHPWKSDGFEYRDTGIGLATGNLAGVRVIRLSGEGARTHHYHHSGEFLFLVILQGEATLSSEKHGSQQMLASDSCVIPAELQVSLTNTSVDLEFLEVVLPAFL